MGDKTIDQKSGVNCPRFRRYDYLQIVCGGASKEFRTIAELIHYEGAYCCSNGRGCPIKKQLERDGVPVDQPAPPYKPRMVQKYGPVKQTRKEPRWPAVDQLKKEQLILHIRREIRQSGKRIRQIALDLGLQSGAISSALCDYKTAMPTLIKLSEYFNLDWREVIHGKTETDKMGAGDQVCAGSPG